MGRQLDIEWIDTNIDKMLKSADSDVRATGRLLRRNRELIRKKANALSSDGINRWNIIKIKE